MTDPDSAISAAASTSGGTTTTTSTTTTAPSSNKEELKGPHGLEAGEEALGKWVRFVEGCFAFRALPPSRHHFLRRLNQDPHSGGAQRPDMIRVVEDGDGNVVAAVSGRVLQIMAGPGRACV